jgi:replicative superfamily II helicase
MAFKKSVSQQVVSDTPHKLFLDLPRRKYQDVLPHQREVLSAYVSRALNDQDVALQLPTGSGKTLVGLLIAEWRLRKNRERVVYLCPTKQLVNQVVEQAEEKYGLGVRGFTGSSAEYTPEARGEYRNADRVAVTTCLFNTNPFFSDADLIIVDDAHVAENYIASMWTVRVERLRREHAVVHLHACHLYISAHELVIRPLIPPTWTHDPFNRACQRIFMSATLGTGGDLERLTASNCLTAIKGSQLNIGLSDSS